MRRETYHLIAVHATEPHELNANWLQACLANARAAFLQQIGLTSARLRAEGLRLGLRPDASAVPEEPPVANSLGITLKLLSHSGAFALAETLYDAGDYWHPFWQGITRVWAEADGEEQILPADLSRELAAWLHLSRGSVPVPSGDGDRFATA